MQANSQWLLLLVSNIPHNITPSSSGFSRFLAIRIFCFTWKPLTYQVYLLLLCSLDTEDSTSFNLLHQVGVLLHLTSRTLPVTMMYLISANRFACIYGCAKTDCFRSLKALSKGISTTAYCNIYHQAIQHGIVCLTEIHYELFIALSKSCSPCRKITMK